MAASIAWILAALAPYRRLHLSLRRFSRPLGWGSAAAALVAVQAVVSIHIVFQGAQGPADAAAWEASTCSMSWVVSAGPSPPSAFPSSNCQGTWP